MGGIAGIVHLEGDPPLRDQGFQLSAGVAHRGPDRKGAWSKGPAVLLHRELRTLRPAVPQPYEHEGLVFVLDGRLYEGDMPALARDWLRRGPDCLADVMGDFALAVWERDTHVLWLARDATGTRPLFWASHGTRHAFASEIPPLLGLPWVSRELSTDNVAEFLSFRYVHAPRTLLRAVHAVPPGHVVRIDIRSTNTERWWRPRWSLPGARPPKDADAIASIDEALAKSVARRAGPDESVAVMLSGGLDSSAMLWHLSQTRQSVPTYTVALSDDPVDESSFAGRVAKVMGADHQVVRISDTELVDHLHDCTRMMGQPLPGASAILQHLLFKAIKPDARVVLSGDGGDEVLAGRGMHQMAARLRRTRLMGRAAGPLNGPIRGLLGRAGMSDLATQPVHFGRDRNIGGSRVFNSTERVEILRDPGMVRPGIRRLVLDPLYQEVDSDPLNAILHVWQRGWLPEDSLSRSDRMAAHAGVEVRYPLLDRDLMATSAAMPGPVKVHPVRLGWVTKWPLRQAMRGRMPDRTYLHRPKRSLPNPLDRWLRGAGRDFLQSSIEGLLSDPTALFAPSAVRRLTQEHLDGKANRGLKLWTLVLFHTWRQALVR